MSKRFEWRKLGESVLEVQQQCKVSVEAERLQHGEAVHLLAVQLVGGRGAAQVEQEHQAEGGRVQSEAEHAATGGDEAGERDCALQRLLRCDSHSKSEGGTWPVGCGRAYWPSGSAGTARVWMQPAEGPAEEGREA